MSSGVASAASSPQSSSSSWFNEDWRNITVYQKNSNGELRKNEVGSPIKFQYTQEISTGDLYGGRLSSDEPTQGLSPDEPYVISIKAIGLFCFTPLYTLGLIVGNLVQIAVKATSIFWRVIPQIIQERSTKGILPAFGNGVVAIVAEIPLQIIQDIWRICRAPIYALGVMFACIYALPVPYEGRKWIGRIENAWHEGASYKMHGQCEPDCISDAKEGKFYFAAICMQKRGNIADKAGNMDKYEICKC